MQVVAGAAQLDVGFRLLNDAYAAGLVEDSYLMHRKLQDACRAAGDSARAEELQTAIERHGLTSKKAEATAVLAEGDKPTKYVCGIGHCTPTLEAALQSLIGRVAHVGYVPQARAANFGFVRDSSTEQLAQSLAHHAEKMALADMVCHECDTYEISVSIKMCVDCHEFFKHASTALSAPLRVKEPRQTHTFEAGRCSCDDRWRWEERRGRKAVAADEQSDAPAEAVPGAQVSEMAWSPGQYVSSHVATNNVAATAALSVFRLPPHLRIIGMVPSQNRVRMKLHSFI